MKYNYEDIIEGLKKQISGKEVIIAILKAEVKQLKRNLRDNKEIILDLLKKSNGDN